MLSSKVVLWLSVSLLGCLLFVMVWLSVCRSCRVENRLFCERLLSCVYGLR